jgi:hypothetical protein
MHFLHSHRILLNFDMATWTRYRALNLWDFKCFCLLFVLLIYCVQGDLLWCFLILLVVSVIYFTTGSIILSLFPPIKRASLCIMHLCIAIEYHWISIWQLEPGIELSTCRNTNAFLYYLCCWFIVSMVTFIMMLSYPSWSFCDLCFTMILPAAYYRCEHRCCSWSHTSYWQPCTWSKNPFFWELSVLITCIACKSHIHFDDDTHAHTIMLFKPWLPECVELVHTFVLCDKWVFNF